MKLFGIEIGGKRGPDEYSRDGVAFQRFDLKGVTLEIPTALVSPAIRYAIDIGVYEAGEAAMIGDMIRPADNVLELGTAIGYVTVIAARAASQGRVVSYEANPKLVSVASNNCRINGVNAEVRHALVESGPERDVSFCVHADFVSSSAFHSDGETITVRSRKFRDILAEVRPNVLIVDIEGGEETLFDDADLSDVRHVVIEVHPALTGLTGVDKVFRALSAQGLVYDATRSNGPVVTFTRAEAAQPASDRAA
ncbi:MAG: FkbM family methyltransferase [Rhodoblastus sp.]